MEATTPLVSTVRSCDMPDKNMATATTANTTSRLVAIVSFAVVGTAVAAAAVSFGFQQSRRKKMSENEEGNDENNKILQVFGFGAPPLSLDPENSPACLKLITFLKMTNTPFEHILMSKHMMKNSPKGKMPFVTGGEGFGENEYVGDSTLIINRLVKSNPTKYDLDQHLTKEQRSIGTFLKGMLEESCYFTCIVYERWYDDETFYNTTVPTYFGELPAIARFLVPRFLLRPKMIRDIKGQGTGLLTDEEVLEKATAELNAVDTYLETSKGPFVFGDKVTSYDATVYAYCAGVIQGDFNHPVNELARTKTNIVNYVTMMRNEYWPELQNQQPPAKVE